MPPSGNKKRSQGGREKEWAPFSGAGHKLGDNGESSGQTLRGPKGRRSRGAASPGCSSEQSCVGGAASPGSCSVEPSEGGAAFTPASIGEVIDLEGEGESLQATDGCGSEEWAHPPPLPTLAAWTQKRDWTLADLVGEAVRSSVFGEGDIGLQGRSTARQEILVLRSPHLFIYQ